MPDRVFNASTCGDNCARWLLAIGRKQDVTINLRHILADNGLADSSGGCNARLPGRVLRLVDQLHERPARPHGPERPPRPARRAPRRPPRAARRGRGLSIILGFGRAREVRAAGDELEVLSPTRLLHLPRLPVDGPVEFAAHRKRPFRSRRCIHC